MSRALRHGADYYKIRAGITMPIRWSAPEVVDGARYTTASDVWSFFVLMWEVWSRAQIPFGAKSGILVVMILEDVKEGLVEPSDVLDKPGHVEEELYQGMQALCWAVDPAGRASFAQLCTWIQERLKEAATDAPRSNPRNPIGATATTGGEPYQTMLARGVQAYAANAATASAYQTNLVPGAQVYAPPSARTAPGNAEDPRGAHTGQAPSAAYGDTRDPDLITGMYDNASSSATAAHTNNDDLAYGETCDLDLVTGLYDNAGAALPKKAAGLAHSPYGERRPNSAAHPAWGGGAVRRLPSDTYGAAVSLRTSAHSLHPARRTSDVNALVLDNAYGSTAGPSDAPANAPAPASDGDDQAYGNARHSDLITGLYDNTGAVQQH